MQLNKSKMVSAQSKPSTRVHVRVRSWEKIKTRTNHIFVLSTIVISKKLEVATPQIAGPANIFVMAMTVLSKRVQVANKLHEKNDVQLLAAGRHYHNEVNGDALFATPNPTLASIKAVLDEFEELIDKAASGEHEQVTLRNSKREDVLNVLCDFENYVETIANLPENATIGPVAVIEAAGMRAKAFTPRPLQSFQVKSGKMAGEIDCIAGSTHNDGTHEWQWRLSSGAPDSWSETFTTKKARITFFGLTRGALIIVRHRVVASSHHAIDWETCDVIAVP